jgi:hypothetical protein
MSEKEINIKELSENDKKIIDECLQACVKDFFPDWEFSTLFGFSRDGFAKIAKNWSNNLSDEDTKNAVSSSLNNLTGYPHGHLDDEVWSSHISVSVKDIHYIHLKISQDGISPGVPEESHD